MNSFGRLFRISIYGESHGRCEGVCVDGVKPGILFDENKLNKLLERRKAGGIATTLRMESDVPIITSGIYKGYTSGSPINIFFENNNQDSENYRDNTIIPRPSHADYVANIKYNGFQDYRGGGHFSGRLTLGIVAAGYFAMEMIPYHISSKIIQIGEMKASNEEEVNAYLKQIADKKNSIGGIVEITVSNVPVGLGEPFFDSVESVLSHLLFSIPSVKGVEFGLGFRGVSKMGSEFNDCIIDETGKTKTNNNGGINGGISNGNDLVIRVFIKPTPSISETQETFNFQEKKMDKIAIMGRHDICIVKRACVVLESAVAIGLADLKLINDAYGVKKCD